MGVLLNEKLVKPSVKEGNRGNQLKLQISSDTAGRADWKKRISVFFRTGGNFCKEDFAASCPDQAVRSDAVCKLGRRNLLANHDIP